MANDKINTQQLVKDLEKAVSETKDLVKLTDKTNDLYTEMAKTIKDAFDVIDKKTTKGLVEFNKALSNTNEILEKQEKNNKKRVDANDELAKQQKKLIALKSKLNSGLSEEAVETEKLNIQVREQAKKRKEIANDALKTIDAYEKESKALRKMKKDLKANVIEMRKLGKSEEEISKATKKTVKEINKLDRELRDLDKSVGDSYREIGKYEEALESLSSTANTVKGALVGVGTELVAGLLVESITSNREAQLELDKLQNKAKATSKVLSDTFIESFSKTKVEEAWAAFDEAADIRKAAQRKLKASWFLSDEEIDRLNSVIKKQSVIIDKKLEEYKVQAKINENDGSTLEGIKNTIEALDNLSDQTLDVEIANKALSRTLVEQEKVQQKLNATSEDDTRGLKEGLALKDELAKQNALVAKTSEEIARNEIKIQTLNVGAELLAKNRISVNDALNLTTEEANNLLKDKTNLLALSETTEEAYTQAYVGFVTARTESEQTSLETQEKRSKLLSDKFEKDLDILIDGGDKLKVINEQIILDDSISNERRQSLLNETKRLAEANFKAQAKTIEEFAHTRINLDSTITESQKKALKEKVKVSDIESLLAIKDARELNDKIRELGLSEIFEGRALEVIREKIQANADFVESQKEVNIALAKTNEINEDILDQEAQLEILRNKEIDTQEELNEAQEKLDDERIQNRIDAINKELELVDKSSLEEVTLNQEKNDLLIEQETKAAEERIENKKEESDREEELEADRIARRKKVLEEGADLFNEILEKRREKEEAALEAEGDALEDRIDQIRDAIGDGNDEARNSLAELEKERIKNEEKKAKLREKEIRDEKIIAGLKMLASNSDKKNAVGKTLGDIALLVASLDQIPAFFEGTENTGTVSNPLDSNGGRAAILHDNERVMTAKQNARIGSMSNEDLADLASMHNSGSLQSGSTVITQNNAELVSEVKEVARAIKSIPIQSYNYDANGKYHEHVMQTANKREIHKQKANNLFK